jgi:hypothetical protein
VDPNDFEDYRTTRYEPQLAWYDAKANNSKGMYLLFQTGVIVLSAVVPVLIAALPAEHAVTISLSVLLAIGTACLKAFKFQENWINFRSTAEALKREWRFYVARLGDYEEAERRESLFVERVEALISNEHVVWMTTQAQKHAPEGEKA